MGAMQRYIRQLAPVAIALAVATLPAAAQKNKLNVNQDTFVISNEAPGFLIDQLINAGYGNENLYQALVDMVASTNPSVSGIVTPAFLQALANCPASSQIFTTQLKDVTSQGVSVSISTDGTARYDDIEGALFFNTYPTLNSTISGVGRGLFTHSTDPQRPLNSTTIDGPLAGQTTVYKAFGVAWSGSVSGLVLGEGPGKLVDSLIAAGYGNFSLYNTLVQIQSETNPSVAGVVTPAFLAALQACPANSTIFTTNLNAYAGTGVAIYADCTAVATSLQGSGFNGLAGNTTLATVISGVGHAAVVSLSPPYASDATHSVLAILYAPQGTSQSFVLSNEDGQLIAKLIAAGYGGSLSLYESLVQIRTEIDPSIGSGLTDAFIGNLQNCPAGAPLFTTQLQNAALPVVISDDCSVQTRSLTGTSFSGQPGTTTLVTNISGVGSASLVSSTSSNPLTSWTAATVTYNVFAILYASGACDINRDGSTNVADVQRVINQALGLSLATNDLNQDGAVNVVDVQIAIDAAINLVCTASGNTPASASASKNSARRNPAPYNRLLMSRAPRSDESSQEVSTVLTATASRPTIKEVLNAASLQNGPISPGEIVTIVGTGLGPTVSAGLRLDRTREVATSLGGVEVLFNGTPAPLTYVSATQIHCVVPQEIQGEASPIVQVGYRGKTSNVFMLTSAPAVPALFTANGSGTGPAAAFNQDLGSNSSKNPAARGSTVVLYMTGEGQTWPPRVTGQITTVSPLIPQPLLPVSVSIGGQPAAIAFYGEAPGLVSAVMQISVQVPWNVPSGDLPISVSVGGRNSQNGVTISVRE